MSRKSSLFSQVSILAVAATLGGATEGHAQVALPEIVVQSPSPIVSQTPATTTEVATEDVTTVPGVIIADDTFASVTIITDEQIELDRSRTIGDTVFTKPGVTSSTFAPGASRPIIRGLDNFRVRIQENGIGAHDVSDISEDHAVPIDPLNQDKIEIIRGPATLRWGSQAIGGVVSATNGRIPDRIPGSGFYRFKAVGTFSSVDDGTEGAVMAEGGEGNLAFHIDAFRREGNNYSIPDAPGTQQNSFYESNGAALGGSVVFDQGFFGLSVSRYESVYAIPGGESEEREVSIDLQQTKLTGRGEFRPLGGPVEAVKLWFGITDYEHDEIALDEDTGVQRVGSTFLNDERELRTEVLFRPVTTGLGQLTTALGMQIGDRDLSGDGEAGELLSPSETERIAGYIFKELETSPTLKFQAAGRIERVNVNGTAGIFPPGFLPPPDEPGDDPRDLEFTPKSASVGVLKRLGGGVVASLTGQYVERAPEAAELFSRGPHEATATFEIGDPNLQIEKAHSVEFGLRKAQGRLRFDGTVYYTEYDGFIFKDFTGIACGEEFADCGVEDELQQIVFSQRDSTHYGGELFGEFDLVTVGNGVFGIDGQFDVVNASFADGTNVPRIPPMRLGGGLYYRDRKVTARVNVLHAFRQDEIGERETPTSSYTLLNTELNYKVSLGDEANGEPRLSLGIVGKNLLDDDIRNHSSFKKDDVLLQGRSVLLKAKLKLN